MWKKKTRGSWFSDSFESKRAQAGSTYAGQNLNETHEEEATTFYNGNTGEEGALSWKCSSTLEKSNDDANLKQAEKSRKNFNDKSHTAQRRRRRGGESLHPAVHEIRTSGVQSRSRAAKCRKDKVSYSPAVLLQQWGEGRWPVPELMHARFTQTWTFHHYHFRHQHSPAIEKFKSVQRFIDAAAADDTDTRSELFFFVFHSTVSRKKSCGNYFTLLYSSQLLWDFQP